MRKSFSARLTARRRRPFRGAALVALAALGALAAPAAASAATGSGDVSLVVPLVAHYAALQRFATAVTTPGNPLYGEYESLATLERRFGATAATQAAVERYLRAHGASSVSADSTGLFVDAQMPRVTAEALFGGANAARAGSAARLPAALRGLATGVVGLDSKQLPVSPATVNSVPSDYGPSSGTQAGCSTAENIGGFTPSQYLTAYGYSTLQSEGLKGQGESVALVEIDGFKHSDVNAFASCFGLPVPSIHTHPVGMRRALSAGSETTLDLEVLDATAPKLKRIDVYESRDTTTDVLRSLTAPLQKHAYHPQVISVSLGLCELLFREAASLSGMRTGSAALELAAASGISVLAASGDWGSSDCVEMIHGAEVPYPQLSVNFPASSPWVTAVGGTNIDLTPANAIYSEWSWNDGSDDAGFGSGGGLSLVFKRPSYQRGTVSVNRRAVPDVAMLADIAPGYDIYCTAGAACQADGHSGWVTVGGTSAATPLLAGGIALIDQRLREVGRRAVGFANPLLYSIGRHAAGATVFTDVTVGNNNVAQFVDYDTTVPTLRCCNAGPGYDLVTGWGSVNLPALEAQAVAREPKLHHKKKHK